MSGPVPYATDFALWAAEQARLLHEKRFDEVDLGFVAREIDRIGAIQRAALRDAMSRLVARLVLWKYLPGARLPAWQADMARERREIRTILEASPSLHEFAGGVFLEAYEIGRCRAAEETGIALRLLPEKPPFSSTEARDDAFLPLEPDLETLQQACPP